VIFVAATLLGFASHAPGGIGVFRCGHAGRVVAVRQGRPARRPALVRLLYYIVPFALSLLILAAASCCSLCAARRRRRLLALPLAGADRGGGNATLAGPRQKGRGRLSQAWDR